MMESHGRRSSRPRPQLPENLADTDLTTFDSEALAAQRRDRLRADLPAVVGRLGQAAPHPRAQGPDASSSTRRRRRSTFRPTRAFTRRSSARSSTAPAQLRNRKMETRLIVARPDSTAADGTVKQTALFGTYVWSDDETTATLANLPYRDGTPFADQVRTYITDELAYQDLVDSIGPAPTSSAAQRSLNDALVDNPDLVSSTTPFPGSMRCVQCHMGSPTEGLRARLLPAAGRAARDRHRRHLRADRRRRAEPAAAPHRLRRDHRDDVAGRRAAARGVAGRRASRAPTSELKAQAYMVGNCAHCHNPRGFPSSPSPSWRPCSTSCPTADDGGIFEFPLERMSPVRARGANGDIPIPYITPSLRDYPVADATGQPHATTAPIALEPDRRGLPS